MQKLNRNLLNFYLNPTADPKQINFHPNFKVLQIASSIRQVNRYMVFYHYIKRSLTK